MKSWSLAVTLGNTSIWALPCLCCPCKRNIKHMWLSLILPLMHGLIFLEKCPLATWKQKCLLQECLHGVDCATNLVSPQALGPSLKNTILSAPNLLWAKQQTNRCFILYLFGVGAGSLPCSPGWPSTQYMAQDGLSQTHDISRTSASQVLGLQACTTKSTPANTFSMVPPHFQWKHLLECFVMFV